MRAPMRLLISFAALFLSVILLQLSSGGVGPLDVLSGTALGFSRQEIGLLGSAHFLGFFHRLLVGAPPDGHLSGTAAPLLPSLPWRPSG